MSFRELTMIEIREVLRRHASGQSLRQIARETGLDRKTVRRYVEAAEQAQADVSDGGVQEVAHRVQARPLPPRSEQRSVLVPHLEPLRKWLCEDGLRLTKVHALLKRRGVDVTYPTLRRFVIDELGWQKQKPTVRLDDPPPGQEAQIDFALMGLVDDPDTGRRRKLWALLVTLSFSRHMFVWPTFEQTTASVIEGLDAAWIFFGGVVRCVLPDNMKAIVVSADHTAPKIQEVFAEYAQHSGFFVDPARVRKPRDKARVENQVQHVRCSWFCGERFDGLAHSRKDAERWCRDIAGTRVHGTTREVPVERFDAKERAALLPLPQTRFDIPRWSDAKVHPDHHIQVGRALYSLPTAYIGRTVRARVDSKMVRIYLGAELIKVHPKKPAGGRSTDPTDYPSGKAAWALRSVDSIIASAHKRGAHVGLYAERLLSVPLPWTRMRQGYQLLRLCDRYGNDRVDTLCARALDFEVIDVPRISRMLKSAQRIEDRAQDDGKLRKLPSQPRFGRDAAHFSTRDKGPGGGAR